MTRRTPIALLLSLAACAILIPATASAIPIHQHITIKAPGTKPITVTRVVDVAPGDRDDDGCRNAKDHYNGPGCKAPPPPPVAAPSQSVAPATTVAPSVPTTSAGGCPSYMAGEASSPDAVNPSSGASGCYQVLPSTADAMGSACSDVNASSCVAAICASNPADPNSAWDSSGATPCDYIKP